MSLALGLACVGCGESTSTDEGADGGSDAIDGGAGNDVDATSDALDAADSPADLATDGDIEVATEPLPDLPFPVSCLAPEDPDSSGTGLLVDALGTASVVIADRDACQRRYTLSSDAELRDGEPDNPRTVDELAGWPTLRSGHDLFDALFALSLDEVRESSVETISDGSFGGGAISCGDGGCFETGRLWTYVWTRDTAYSIHLGLATLDPTRSGNSLAFKLSQRRSGGDRQIVQDTGSGGSYPVSTDRVAWAMGAASLLDQLRGGEHADFRDLAYEALSNTAEHDRAVAYDPSDGLYRGETSFLDWREQTYGAWTQFTVVDIAMSKSLSTNLLHLRMLELASQLAGELGETETRDRYLGWAESLREAIDERFWQPDDGLYSSFIANTLDPSAVRRYDLLGSALAVVLGVADETRAEQVLANYPHYGTGAPVIWPQQQNIRIYHNRGEWPFVSAYWLRAAKIADNDAVVDRMVGTLVRGAAVNLSNMENFEASTGAAHLDDGTFSGPVVNSQRQLWSVAGYVSMVYHTLFGLEAAPEGLRINPYITRGLRDDLFAGTDRLVLNDYPHRGRTITVVLELPVTGGAGGSYTVGDVRLNGEPAPDAFINDTNLRAANLVEVELIADPESGGATLTLRSDDDWRQVFGPRTPRITELVDDGGRVRLTLATSEDQPADVTFSIYRDGARIASNIAGTTESWLDDGSDTGATTSPCYAVEATFSVSGNHSQHSRPVCWWGTDFAAIQSVQATDFIASGGTLVDNHGRMHYENWGDAGHELVVNGLTPTRDGPHYLQVVYGNGAGPINTGITCAVKELLVERESDDALIASGYLVMPQVGTWGRWEDSTLVPAELQADQSYRVTIRGSERAVNMSFFDHFQFYSGLGGEDGTFNRVNIAELRLLRRTSGL